MKMNEKQIGEMFENIATIFAEHAEELCTMDAKLGDGDLGLTMKKGFAELPKAFAACEEKDLGKKIMKAAMKMASAVPSTMGTLMSSGVMTGGKKLVGKADMGATDLVEYLKGFAEGITKRGKCRIGDRTVLDSVGKAAESAAGFLAVKPDADLAEIITVAYDAAVSGAEATKKMEPKFGKAAIHKAACADVVDQGALAGTYMLEGMKTYILKMEG